MYVTGMATRRVANADPPTPIPDTKVSENTLYTIARLNERERERKQEKERESEGDRESERGRVRESESEQNRNMIQK